jgi:hypothetical protein
MKASKKQIELILAYVKKERERLPKYSVFGGNNWESMDAEIRALEKALQGEYPKDDLDSDIFECISWLNDTGSSDYGNAYL